MNSALRCSIIAVTLCLGASGCTSTRLPTALDFGEGVENFKPAERLSNATGRYAHWQAIGRVRVDGARICTGSLIDTRGANNEPTGPAYVLTSGHCAKGNSNQFLIDVPVSGSVTFNFFEDTQSQQKTYPISHIVWSTMRGRDLAILELDRSLDQLVDDGVTPLKLASRPLSIDSNVLVVGASVDNYVHRAACSQEDAADILETGWVWPDQLKNRCVDVKPGVSGSPVLDRYTNEIVALIGTTTQGSGPSLCTSSSPCEVVDGNAVKSPDTNYATDTANLAACFSGGRFSYQNGACVLGPASNFDPAFGESFLRMIRDQNGEFIPLHWEQKFVSDQPYYRVKNVRTPGDCAKDIHYGPVQASLGNGDDRSSHELREGPGLYFLCIIGQPHKTGPASRWAAFNAKVYYRWALAEPVKRAPVYTVIEETPNEFTVKPVGISPDLDLMGYEYKIGAPGTLDCGLKEGYQRIRPPLLSFLVSASNGRKQVCLRTFDMAGNPSPIADFLMPAQAQ